MAAHAERLQIHEPIIEGVSVDVVDFQGIRGIAAHAAVAVTLERLLTPAPPA